MPGPLAPLPQGLSLLALQHSQGRGCHPTPQHWHGEELWPQCSCRGSARIAFLQRFLPLTGAKWLSALGKPSSSCCWVGLALCSGATGAVVCLVSRQQHFTRKLLAGLFSWLEAEEGEIPPVFSPSPGPWAEYLVGTSHRTQLLACARPQGVWAAGHHPTCTEHSTVPPPQFLPVGSRNPAGSPTADTPAMPQPTPGAFQRLLRGLVLLQSLACPTAAEKMEGTYRCP